MTSTITGSGGVTLYGNALASVNSSFLQFGTANTYTGGTTLNGAVVVTSLKNAGVAWELGAATADPANLVINSGGLYITGSSGTLSTDRGITINGADGITGKGNAIYNFNGRITGTGSLQIFGDFGGSGVVVLGAANDFTGDLKGGTDGRVRLANVNAASMATLDTAGTRFSADLSTNNLAYVFGRAPRTRGQFLHARLLGTGGG